MALKDRPAGSVDTVLITGADWRKGPYGVDLLPARGYEIRGALPPTHPAHIKARDVVEHRSGLEWDIPVRGVWASRGADLCLGIFEPATRVAAWMRSRRLPPYRKLPVVMITCWLAQLIQDGDGDRRRDLVRTYGGLDLLLTLSSNQVDFLCEAGFDPDRVASIPYGCAPWLFAGPPVERDIDILAMGSDHGRDYGTLFRAVAGTHLKVQLVCSPRNIAGLTVPPNVNVVGRVSFEEYRTLLRRARIVAIPTRELQYPTGQTVALESAAAGACVAVTDTRPMRDYFDASTAWMIPAGDSDGWRTALLEATADPDRVARTARAGHERVLGGFTYDHMWDAFDHQVRAHGLPAPTVSSPAG